MAFDGGPSLAVRGTGTFDCPFGTCNHLDRYTVILSNDHADPAIAFYGGTTGTTFLGAIATGLTLTGGGQFAGSLNFIGGSLSSTFAWLNGAGTRGASLEVNTNTGAHTLKMETANGQPAIRFSNEARFVIGPHVNAYLQASGGTIWTPATLQSTAAAATTAISVGTTGAFLDVGGGTQDYFVSDGTSLSTPTNFGAAQLSATQGLYLAANTPPPTPNGAGHLYASSKHVLDTGGNVFVYDGQNWRQLGQGKRWGVQKREMRVEVGLEGTAPHTMRAPILDGSGGDSTWTCADSGTVPTNLVSGGRPFRRSTTSSVANSTAYCHTGSTAGTLVGVTQKRAKPNVCAWARTGTSATNVRLWWGLFNNFTGAISDSPTSQHVAALRYSTSTGDTGWVLVTCNASSCTETPTGVLVGASKNYLLCVDISDDTGAVFAYVNESSKPGTIVSSSTTLPNASTWLGFIHYVETLSASSNDFGLSHLSLETN
jgi:hypothetical protein